MTRLAVVALLGSALASAGLAPAASGRAYRGTIEIRHSDDFAHGRSHTSYELVRGRQRTPLALKRAPRTPSGSKVVVSGRGSGLGIRGIVRPHGLVRAASAASGPRTTAVLLVNFASDTRTPWTVDSARRAVFTAADSTAAFYAEESHGGVTLVGKRRTDGDVLGWFTIAGPTAGCDVNAWAKQAQAAATAADGFVAADYDHIVYAFPKQASCGGWSGLGELPGRRSWLNGTIATRVVAHELGHNMGLHHASSLTCTSAGATVAYSSTCTPDEYGDPFDVMGNSLRRNNAWHLEQIGFMARGNVRTASSSGTYTVTASRAAGSGTQLLRVPLGPADPNRFYDLELRASGGVFDNFLSTDPAVQGLTIHLDPQPSVVEQSLLIDATPGSPDGFDDAPLAPGSSFSDGTVQIVARAVSGGTATVDVLAAPQPDVTPPSRPAPLSAEAGNGRVTLSWPAATDEVGVAGYHVYRDGQQIATTSETGWVDGGVAAGTTYSYRVVAYDAALNTASSPTVRVAVPLPPPAEQPPPADPGTSAAAPPVVPPPGAVRPHVRIVSPARGARVHRRAVIRAAAHDAVGIVRTEVWVDGVRRRTVSGGRIAWRWPLRATRRGRHSIVVRAFDASGNSGRAVVRVRVAT